MTNNEGANIIRTTGLPMSNEDLAVSRICSKGHYHEAPAEAYICDGGHYVILAGVDLEDTPAEARTYVDYAIQGRADVYISRVALVWIATIGRHGMGGCVQIRCSEGNVQIKRIVRQADGPLLNDDNVFAHIDDYTRI